LKHWITNIYSGLSRLTGSLLWVSAVSSQTEMQSPEVSQWSSVFMNE